MTTLTAIESTKVKALAVFKKQTKKLRRGNLQPPNHKRTNEELYDDTWPMDRLKNETIQSLRNYFKEIDVQLDTTLSSFDDNTFSRLHSSVFEKLALAGFYLDDENLFTMTYLVFGEFQTDLAQTTMRPVIEEYYREEMRKEFTALIINEQFLAPLRARLHKSLQALGGIYRKQYDDFVRNEIRTLRSKSHGIS